MIKSKAAILFILLLIFISIFSNLWEYLTGLTLLGFADEFLLSISILMLCVTVVIEKKISRLNAYLFIGLCYMIGVSFLAGKTNNLTVIIVQSIIHLKFFFFLFLLQKIPFNTLKKFVIYVFAFSLVGALINMANPQNFNSVFGIYELERSFLVRLAGFEFHPNKLGFLFFVVFVLINSSVIKVRSYKQILNAFIILIIFFTGSRTTYLLLLITILYNLWFMRTLYHKALIVAVFSVTALVFYSSIKENDFVKITQQNITNSLTSDANDSHYVRGIMIYNGGRLFIENFPIGTGVSTYGSQMSANSVVYDDLGVSELSFFREMTGVYDSNLATIMGELGFMGLLLFGWLLRAIKHEFKSIKKEIFWLVVFTVVLLSFTQPVLMNTHTSLLLALMVVLLTSKEKRMQAVTTTSSENNDTDDHED